MTTGLLFDDTAYWRQVKRTDDLARRIVDGVAPGMRDRLAHYSRQTPGAADFMANGRTFVLVGRDDLSVWGVIENTAPVPPQLLAAYRRGEYAPAQRWRCSIFRRDPASSGPVASEMVRSATEVTYARWFRASYRHSRGGPRWVMPVPLTTEIDPTKTRRKRDPGRCFRRAGWEVLDEDRNGLVVLWAAEADRRWRSA